MITLNSLFFMSTKNKKMRAYLSLFSLFHLQICQLSNEYNNHLTIQGSYIYTIGVQFLYVY
jgi:hypothetical protein